MAGTRAFTRILGAYSTASDLVMFTRAALVMLYQAKPGRGRVAPVLEGNIVSREPRREEHGSCSSPCNVENPSITMFDEVRENNFGGQVVGFEVDAEEKVEVGLGKLMCGLL